MPSPVASSRFVGREAQLARLQAALARAAAGRQTTVLVRGEAGVGKSRLLRELLAPARDRGATTLLGGCVEISSGELPFVPIRAALRGVIAEHGADALADRVGPAWATMPLLLPELSSTASADIADADGHVFETVAAIVRALCVDGPVVLAVDDAQWADLSTLQLLRFLTQDPSLPFLLGVFYRGEEVPSAAARRKAFEELGRASVDVVDVPPLEDAPATELVAHLGSDLGDDARRRVLGRASGMPFLVEELVAAERDGLTGGVPTRFGEVLRLRLGQLDAAARDVVDLVAVAGRPIEHRVIATATGLDATDLTRAVAEAEQAQVLRENPSRQLYGFRHDLVRELAHAELSAASRAELHVRLAAALEARLPPDPYATRLCEVAHHWLQADGHVDAAIWAALRAARASTKARAHPEAVQQYEYVVRLWHRAAAAEQTCGVDLVTLLADAAEACHWAGFTDQALRHVEHALRLVAPEDVTRVATLHDRRTLYSWLDVGHLTRGHELLATIEAEVTRERMRASELMQSGRYVDSIEVARRAASLARAAGATHDDIRARIILGVGLAMTGEVADGVSTIREALRRASEVDYLMGVVGGYVNLAFVLLADGQLEQAAQVCLTGLRDAEERGWAAADGAVLAGNAAEALTRLGRLQEADAAIESALARQPPPAMATFLSLARAEVDVLRGRLDQAETTLRDIVEHGTLDDYQFQGQLRVVEAELQLWDPAGERAVVLGDLRDGLGSRIADLPVEEDVPLTARLLWLAARADADAAALALMQGDAERVTALQDDADSVRARAGRLDSDALSDGSRRQLALFRALIEAESGRLRGAAAPPQWQACVDSSGPEPYLRDYALWRLGGSLHADRRRPEARRVLREAYDVATRADLRMLATAIQVAATSLGLRVDTPLPAQRDRKRAYGLTPRESEVLALLVDGYSNRRIASALFMTEKTASVHVSRILAKLAVSSRAEAVSRAYETGLARPDGPHMG